MSKATEILDEFYEEAKNDEREGIEWVDGQYEKSLEDTEAEILAAQWNKVEDGLPEESITNQYRLWVFAQDDGKDIGFTGVEIHGRYFEGAFRGARHPLSLLCTRVVAYQLVTAPGE